MTFAWFSSIACSKFTNFDIGHPKQKWETNLHNEYLITEGQQITTIWIYTERSVYLVQHFAPYFVVLFSDYIVLKLTW